VYPLLFFDRIEEEKIEEEQKNCHAKRSGSSEAAVITQSKDRYQART
jgi:hypothetical protein